MYKEIVLCLVLLLGFTGCTQESTNRSEELLKPSVTPSASPSTLVSQSAAPSTQPSDSEISSGENNKPVASILPTINNTRCDKNGQFKTSNKIQLQIVQTKSDFSQKEVKTSRFLCHHPQNDTLFITNATEVLEFDPRTLELKTIIDERATGFKSDKNANFKFQRLRECLLDKEGLLYLADAQTQEVQRVDLQKKEIRTLQHTLHGTEASTSKFGYITDFTLASDGQVFLSDLEHLYRVEDLKTQLVFQTSNAAPVYKGSFPQQIDPESRRSVADITRILAITADDRKNIYMTNSAQNSFLKLDRETQTISLIDPKGIQELESPERSTYLLGSINSLEYNPKYNVFFGALGASIITRDGCLGNLLDSDQKVVNTTFTDVSIMNDGEVFFIDSKNLNLFKLIIPPDLPEKAQWEPPQAWKDATGME